MDTAGNLQTHRQRGTNIHLSVSYYYVTADTIVRTGTSVKLAILNYLHMPPLEPSGRLKYSELNLTNCQSVLWTRSSIHNSSFFSILYGKSHHFNNSISVANVP